MNPLWLLLILPVTIVVTVAAGWIWLAWYFTRGNPWG